MREPILYLSKAIQALSLLPSPERKAAAMVWCIIAAIRISESEDGDAIEDIAMHYLKDSNDE